MDSHLAFVWSSRSARDRDSAEFFRLSGIWPLVGISGHGGGTLALQSEYFTHLEISESVLTPSSFRLED